MSDAPSPPERSANGPGSSERFVLRVPSTFGPRFFMTVATAVGLVVVLFARPLLESGESAYLIALLAAAAVVPGLVALLTSTGRQQRRLSIEVLDDRLQLPMSGPGRLAVRYRDINALFLQRHGMGGFLFIGTAERELTFPLRAFPGDEADRLVQAIRSRIERSEGDGARRLASIDRLARVSDRAFARRPVVTLAVVAITSALHLFMLATDRLVGVLDVASFGAVSPELVQATGPYLAFVSNWVHGWSFQPLLILPGLFVVGAMVERLLGHGAAALSILGSATVGGLAAAYYPGAPLHAGTLIPAAGLVGTLAFTAHQYRGRMPIGFRLSGQWWAWVGTLVAIAALIHGITVPGMLLGLLTGILVAAGATDRDPELPLAYSPRWAALLAGGLGLLHVGAAAWAIEDLPGRGLELEAIAVEHLHDGRRLNEYAWQLAVYADKPSEARLELGLVAARRAVGLEENELIRLTNQDTEATVLHRLGRHEEAVRLERDVLEARPDAISAATQLARFLVAWTESGHAPVEASEGLEIELQRRPDGDSVAFDSVLRLATAVPEPRVLYAPVKGADGTLKALLRLPIPAGVTTATSAVELVQARSEVGESLQVVPAFSVAGRASGKLWPMAPGFLEFP